MTYSNKDNLRKVSRSYSGIPQVILGQGGATIDAWGTPKFVQDLSLTHTLFTYDLSQRKILIYENDVELLDNNASTRAISEGGALKISSGAVLNDDTYVRTKQNPKYQPDRGHKYAVSTIIDTAYTVGSTIKFGIGTKTNRVYFEVSDGVIYGVIVSGSIVKHKEVITLPSEWNIDLTKNQLADIIFQYRGTGNYKFYWGNPLTGYLEKVHEINYLNIENTLSMENPALPIFFEALNNGAEAIGRFGCADVSSEGGKRAEYGYTRATTTKDTITDNVVLAIRIPNIYKGKELTRDFILQRISADSDKKGTIKIYLTRDTTCLKKSAVDLVDGDWNLALNGSALEETILADSYDANKAILIRPVTIQANIDAEIDSPTDVSKFYMTPGDILFVVGIFSLATVNLTIELGEEI